MGNRFWRNSTKQHSLGTSSHHAIEEMQSSAERFFGALMKDPSYCCFGEDLTCAAMSFYNVAELFICKDVPAACTSKWEANALEYKARLNWVDCDCDAGKRFRRGGGVGALLRRPIDQDELEMFLDSPREDVIDSCRDIIPIRSEPTQSKTQICISPPNKPDNEFYAWLQESLLSELDENGSSALLMCVEVLLEDGVINDNLAVHEVLQSIAEVLTDNAAPNTAQDVAARWYATEAVF
eukprot:gnl/MRDRNA2_/MRDRNA2_106159_c0_seq1.p1 gnl/MRDRNA2_/MRDRNA2_106159_c0~~gnl/MRDRNA2_/MRDRNA2_106159_c0_seq1.p1  ORF type:complete len:238 (+),score=48.81 gnl/MRDRNA2_/MRDRNA2_106159_c0_seq1:87-800(+)